MRRHDDPLLIFVSKKNIEGKINKKDGMESYTSINEKGTRTYAGPGFRLILGGAATLGSETDVSWDPVVVAHAGSLLILCSYENVIMCVM